MYIFTHSRRRNSDFTGEEAVNNTFGKENAGKELFISVDIFDNEYHKENMRTDRYKKTLSGKVKGKMSQILRRKNRFSDDVKLTIEKEEEKIEMTHAEIAHWIDTKARWLFPLMFVSFVIFYSVSIKCGLMDKMLQHF